MAWTSSNGSSSSSRSSKEGGMNGDAIPRRRPVLEVIALGLWLGAFQFNTAILILCFFLPRVWALTAIAIFLTQAFIPTFADTCLGDRVARFICTYGPAYFPMHGHVEDLAAFDPDRSYLLAVEPHSVFPVGIVALTKFYGWLPLKRTRLAGSSALLWTPIVRHVYSWLGLVPAGRKVLSKLLGDRTSVIVVPGGVQECLYMKPGQEAIFLRTRYGFVRCAIEAGSPLVPVFCFGQSEAYHYLKPSGKWYSRLSRLIGFTPMLIWGAYGTPIPYRHPIHIVVGKPIEVEKKAHPSREEITAMLGKFIAAMEELYERHKEEAGYKDTILRVL